MSFKEKTIDEVITPLRRILSNRSGYVYQSLGHFYREIELLKFPFMKDSPYQRYNPSHGRNVYSQQQYETIVDHCITNRWITITDNPNRNGWYIVRVLPFNEKQSSVDNTEQSRRTVYPPIVPEASSYKPMGALARRAADEENRKAQAVLDAMSLSMSLDPDVNWCIRFVDGHPFLSVNQ